MTTIVAVEGPLDPGRLRWVAGLYGEVDPRYRDPAFLAHLFAASPAGPGLHAFALDAERPVGHCAVVPMRARRGSGELRSGKVEALFVAPSHRGSRSGSPPVVASLLERLFAFADEQGVELLHAYVRPEVGRLFVGFAQVEVGERSLVAVARPTTLTSPAMQARGAVLAAGQGALRTSASALVRLRAGSPWTVLREPTTDDVELVSAPRPPAGSWTVLAEDAWDWYRASPHLRVLELSGRLGSRALVQLPGSRGDPLRLVGWRPERAGIGPALALLGAAGRLARRRDAATLRFQPWRVGSGSSELERACRLLGFVRRSDFTTLYVRARDGELARPDRVVPTPLLYLGF